MRSAIGLLAHDQSRAFGSFPIVPEVSVKIGNALFGGPQLA
jgi:hypothetical protein